MKLPKNFGGQGFGGMMQQMKDAMARAQSLEEELQAERFEVEKGPVKALFAGTGEPLAIRIDPSVVDPAEVEMLEDLVISVMRGGFESATQLRNARVQGILPNVPEIPGITS